MEEEHRWRNFPYWLLWKVFNVLCCSDLRERTRKNRRQLTKYRKGKSFL